MTFISHLHPQFGSVFSIEAANEPTMNATQTPGYGDCERPSHSRLVYTAHSHHVLSSSEEFCQDRARGGVAYRGRCARVSVSRWHAERKNLHERLTQASEMDTLGLFTSPVTEALNTSFHTFLYVAKELEWMIDFTACQERVPITTRLVFTFSLSL